MCGFATIIDNVGDGAHDVPPIIYQINWYFIGPRAKRLVPRECACGMIIDKNYPTL